MKQTASILNFTRRLFQFPPIPPSPSSSHSSLSSFTQYALRANLPPTSTLYLGTHYEYTIQTTLRRYAFNLHRVGGRSDQGVDLVGTWHPHPLPLPPSPSPNSPEPRNENKQRQRYSYDPEIRVLVQCKSLKAKIGPNVVRELEGTFRTAPAGFRGDNVLGVLVSTREATKGVRDALGRSAYPLLWMMASREGTVEQVLWNGRMEGLGLAGLGVEMVYEGSSSPSSGETRRGVVGFTWDGGEGEVPSMEEVEGHLEEVEEGWVRKWGEMGVDLGTVSKDEILDAVERCVPGTRPVMISEEEREKVVEYLRLRAGT